MNNQNEVKRNIEFTLNIKNNTEIELSDTLPKALTHELQNMLDRFFPKLFNANDVPKTEGIPFVVGVVIDDK